MATVSAKMRNLLSPLRKISESGQHFFIYDELKQNVKKELIFDILRASAPRYHHRPEIVEKVLEKGLQLLCCLVWISQEEYITFFLEHDALRLPIKLLDEVNRIAPGIDDRFYKEQWEFCPWRFEKDSVHMSLPDNTILPFLPGTNDLIQGAGGEICIITIPASQQNFLDAQVGFFVYLICSLLISTNMCSQDSSTVIAIRKRIKQLRTSEATDNAFRAERDCLDLYHTLRHPNIIEILGSFTLQTDHNVLFPKLHMDLATFLARETRYGEFKQNVTFYSALAGLASAIEAVHNFNLRSRFSPTFLIRFGYHHDIRPANILVTPTTLILADFGLAKIKTLDEISSEPGIWKPNRGDYIAPECMDEELSHRNVGWSYDIWSFGCLLADIASYMEFGPTGISKFRAERRSTHYYEEPYINYFFFEKLSLKSGVSSWLTNMLSNPRDSVVKSLILTAKDMLRIKIEDRLTTVSTTIRLVFLHSKRVYLDLCDDFALVLNNLSKPQHEVSLHTILELEIEVSKIKAVGSILGLDNPAVVDCKFFKDISFAQLVQRNLEGISAYLRSFQAVVDQNVKIWSSSTTEAGVIKEFVPRKFIDD
jgi:serine/threonine protein kinase